MRPIEEILNNKQFKVINIVTDESEEGLAIRVDGNFFDPVTQKRYYTIFTSSLGWEHASVSQPNKTPTWDVMCRIKDIFWKGDECCVEYHPKEEDYVNMHEHCLHIWKPIGIELPMPPSIMVGFKDVSAEEAKMISKAIVSQMSIEDACKKTGFSPNRRIRRQMK